MASEQIFTKELRQHRVCSGKTWYTELFVKAADLIDSQAAEIERLEKLERRAIAMMPVFQDARDAITALTKTQCKLHRIRPDLADCMDTIGIKERWEAREAAQSAAQETAHE